MISTFLKPILLIAIMSFSSLLAAIQFDNPYQGNVMVSSFSESELQEKALIQVLIKVSGNNDIASLPETKSLLKKTQQLISQFGYQAEQDDKYFSALFDQRKINQSLRDMQQPVWGDTRPITLVWLINNNQLVSEQNIKLNEDSVLTNSLRQAQQNRGIQVQFPLMDLDDNLAISVSDVKGRFYDQVANATARYARGHFVLAELKAVASNNWKLSWQLVQVDSVSKQHRILKSEQYTDSKSDVTGKMIDALTDYYADQYAIIENQNEKFTQTIYIKGINSLDKLTKLNNVLSNLLAISNFSIISAKEDQVSIEVKIKGSVASFKNTLMAQPNLQLGSYSTNIIEGNQTRDNALINQDEVANAEALYFNWR